MASKKGSGGGSRLPWIVNTSTQYHWDGEFGVPNSGRPIHYPDEGLNGIQADDLLVLFAFHESTSGFETPSGFTAVSDLGGGNVGGTWYYRVATGSESGDIPDFRRDSINSNACAICACIRDAQVLGGATEIFFLDTTYEDEDTSTDWDNNLDFISPVHANSLYLLFLAVKGGSGGITLDGGQDWNYFDHTEEPTDDAWLTLYTYEQESFDLPAYCNGDFVTTGSHDYMATTIGVNPKHNY